MLTRERFILLLEKYTSGDISSEERTELLTAISSGKYDDLISGHIDTKLKDPTISGADLPPHRSAEILHKILSSEKQNALLLPKKSKRFRMVRWIAAATIIGILAFSIYYISDREDKKVTPPIVFGTDTEIKTNTSAEPAKIIMEEGTVITLQPGSIIHYPTHFLPDKREVFLEGEAFFEVSKNSSRPFFVYNKSIVTHVLGTSFTVKVNKETQQVEVSVRSGRVEVYENTETQKSTTSKKSNGVILLPNQKAIYDEAQRQFVSSLVDKPLPLIEESNDKAPVKEEIVFDETPLKTVLPTLERSYGVEITVENEDLYKCLFTGDISQQDLYTRLDIICKATGASYEVKGTNILIKGKGCN